MGQIYARHPRASLAPRHETSIWVTCASVYDLSICRLVSLSRDGPSENRHRELFPDDFTDICIYLGADRSLPLENRCAYVVLLQSYFSWVAAPIPPDIVSQFLSSGVFEFTTELLKESRGVLPNYFDLDDPKGRLGRMTFQERVFIFWARMLAAVETVELREEAIEQVVASRTIGIVAEWSFTCSAVQSRRRGNLALSSNLTRV